MSAAIDREAACRAVCIRCSDGWPIETDASGPFHRHEGMQWVCFAVKLRALPSVEPAPQSDVCPVCEGFGEVRRAEGDHLGGSVWNERCPGCAGGGA